jgi:hypothetical protein
MLEEIVNSEFTKLVNQAGFKNLETQNSDSENFKEISIWTLRNIINQAFLMGMSVSDNLNRKIK